MTLGDYAAIAFLVIVVLAVFVAGWAAFTAPEGYQDNDGFKYGREP